MNPAGRTGSAIPVSVPSGETREACDVSGLRFRTRGAVPRQLHHFAAPPQQARRASEVGHFRAWRPHAGGVTCTRRRRSVGVPPRSEHRESGISLGQAAVRQAVSTPCSLRRMRFSTGWHPAETSWTSGLARKHSRQNAFTRSRRQASVVLDDTAFVSQNTFR